MEVILDTLRKINLQARKLEWRGKGLDDLPKGQVREDLKKKVTQLRAAVVTLRDIKKDKGLGNAAKRTIRMLSSEATEAVKLVEQFAKGLPDLEKMSVEQKEEFLQGEGDYVSYGLDVRRKLWNDWVKSHRTADLNLSNFNLSGLNLSNFDFGGIYLSYCKFSKTNLTGASFFHSKFSGTKFIDSNLESADFSTSSFLGEVEFIGVKATKANKPVSG